MSEQKPFRAAGVIGWPIFQSRSPQIHTYWLKKYGIPGVYIAMPVQPGRLGAALHGLAALGFAGCNVTLPHKEHTAELVDEIDELGRRAGAVNLVVVNPDGSLSGSNKDCFGFIESVREVAPDWRANAGPAVVLGAGGAARSVVVSLLDAGAGEVRVINRTHGRTEQLATLIGGPVHVFHWREREAALAGAALLVNATNQGMVSQPKLDLRLDDLPRTALVCDIIFNPLETPLLAAARARGNPVVDGLGMLLHQARPAFDAWFGVFPDVTPELRAAIELTLR
jgi:shikimate dehydrogenase